MAQTAPVTQSKSPPATGAGLQRRGLHPIILIDYIPRIVGHMCVFTMAIATMISRGNYFWIPYVLGFIEALIWPHVALIISKRSKNPKFLELQFLVLDSFYIGCWITYLNFALMPSMAMMLSVNMANFSIEGFKLAIKGWIAIIIGGGIVAVFHGLHFQPETPIIASMISIFVLLLFTSTMGFLTYIRAGMLKETKHKLRGAYHDLENLNRVLKSASSSLELDSVMQQIASSFNAFFTFDVITLQIAEETNNELRFKAISGIGMTGKIGDLSMLHPKLNYENCLSVKAYIDNAVVYIPEVSSNMELSYIDKNIHEITACNSLIYVPLVVQNKEIGVIGFLSKKRMVITEKTMNTIRLQLSHISLILRNAVLYGDLKHTST